MFFTPLGLAVMLIKHQRVRRTVRLFTLSSVQVPILLPDGLEFKTLISAFCSGNHTCLPSLISCISNPTVFGL